MVWFCLGDMCQILHEDMYSRDYANASAIKHTLHILKYVINL